MVIYNSQAWYIYSMDGALKQRTPVYKDNPLQEIRLRENKEHQFILRSSDPKDREMTFAVLNANIDNHFLFHSALAVTRDNRTVYASIEISDYDIACYTRSMRKFRWEYQRSFNNTDEVYSLTLSEDDTHLAATMANAFKVWDLRAKLSKEGKEVNMPLPQGTVKQEIFASIIFAFLSVIKFCKIYFCVSSNNQSNRNIFMLNCFRVAENS